MLEVDQIYNLACPASPVHYQYNPVKTVKTNVMGMINMLGHGKTRQGAHFAGFDVSEVYGDPLVHPQTEDYFGNVNPIGLRSCYDEGKRVAETLMMDYHRQSGVDTRIVRIFNTYGERMLENDGRVVSNFIVQALRGEELTIYGDGSQTRSFCYVSDLVDGIIRLMNAEADDIHMPVNIGNPGEFTMNELAERGRQSDRQRDQDQVSAAAAGRPETAKAEYRTGQSLLGWEPTVPLAEGLKENGRIFCRADSLSVN